MNILGIIAEFNPLHTGHAYLIRRLRLETGAAFCVVVMSGDYVQRGEPAFFSKYLRTRAALLCGADLVLELPLSVSTGSAEYFALGAVSLLDRLHCITHLGFGSESGDIRTFQLAGALLSEEPAPYRHLLQDFLKKGMSFPKARYEALSAFLSKDAARNTFSDNNSPSQESVRQGDISLSPDEISGVLSLLDAPNNILGTEYMKALYRLHSSMIPVTLKRSGAGYHETINLSGSASAPAYASASGLRNAFLSSPEKTDSLLGDYVPAACRALYLDALRQKQYVTFEDFFLPLYHTLQYADAEMLSRYQDVTPEFSGRLLRLFGQCSSVAELCAVLKARHLTSTGISRALLHILLHLTEDTVSSEKKLGLALFARILGFRKEAKPLLSLLKKNASIPLVSKLADAPSYLSPAALFQLRQTIIASELYRAALPGGQPGSEYQQHIVLL